MPDLDVDLDRRQEVAEVFWISPTLDQSSHIANTLAGFGLILTGLIQLVNPTRQAQYMANKQAHVLRMGTKPVIEHNLWHMTSKKNAQSIAVKNFDPRRAVRSEYGYGVCFTPCPNYALAHCNPDIEEENQVLIRSRVLIGNTCLGYPYMQVPPPGFDTASDEDGHQLIKFAEDTFLPEYFMTVVELCGSRPCPPSNSLSPEYWCVDM